MLSVLALGLREAELKVLGVEFDPEAAREEFDGTAMKRLGVPTILSPMRNAVDYAVEALTAISSGQWR